MHRAARPCPTPGCAQLIVKHNGCPTHGQLRNYSGSVKLWDRDWAAFAPAWLASHPLCGDCDKRATAVHHLIPVRVAPHRRCDPTNVVSLCPSCHARRHILSRATTHQDRRRTR